MLPGPDGTAVALHASIDRVRFTEGVPRCGFTGSGKRATGATEVMLCRRLCCQCGSEASASSFTRDAKLNHGFQTKSGGSSAEGVGSIWAPAASQKRDFPMSSRSGGVLDIVSIHTLAYSATLTGRPSGCVRKQQRILEDEICGCGGIGRRPGFRYQCRKACRFNSCHPYQFGLQLDGTLQRHRAAWSASLLWNALNSRGEQSATGAGEPIHYLLGYAKSGKAAPSKLMLRREFSGGVCAVRIPPRAPSFETEKDISSVLRQIQLGNATSGSSADTRRPGQPLSKISLTRCCNSVCSRPELVKVAAGSN